MFCFITNQNSQISSPTFDYEQKPNLGEENPQFMEKEVFKGEILVRYVTSHGVCQIITYSQDMFPHGQMEEMVNDAPVYDGGGGHRPHQAAAAAAAATAEEDPVVGMEIYTWDSTNNCIDAMMSMPGDPGPLP